jgi:tetratricopeptide (TPR) repeat protein
MQHVPYYIVKSLQNITVTDDLEQSNEILKIEVEKEEDRDYLYTLATSYIRNSSPPQFVLERCEGYLPLIKTPECRKFMQSIRIWKYEDLEQYEKAIALRIEQVEEQTDNRGHNYQDIAQAYKKMNDNANAIKYYEYYMESYEYGVDTVDFVELANLYEAVKDFKNSAKYHKMAAAYEARFSADHWQMVGRALALDGQIDESMFYFKMALQIEPTDAHSHYFMGRAYQAKKDKFRALHHYMQALKANPDFVAVHLNIGTMEFEDEGDVKAAIQCFENVIDKDTKGEFLHILYRNLRALYTQILDYDKAEYYRGKIFELAGFPAEMGEFLDGLKDGNIDFDIEGDDE